MRGKHAESTLRFLYIPQQPEQRGMHTPRTRVVIRTPNNGSMQELDEPVHLSPTTNKVGIQLSCRPQAGCRFPTLSIRAGWAQYAHTLLQVYRCASVLSAQQRGNGDESNYKSPMLLTLGARIRRRDVVPGPAAPESAQAPTAMPER